MTTNLNESHPFRLNPGTYGKGLCKVGISRGTLTIQSISRSYSKVPLRIDVRRGFSYQISTSPTLPTKDPTFMVAMRPVPGSFRSISTSLRSLAIFRSASFSSVKARIVLE